LQGDYTLLPSAISVFELAFQDGVSNNAFDTKIAKVMLSMFQDYSTATSEQTMTPSQSKTAFEGKLPRINKKKNGKSKHSARGIIAADLFVVNSNAGVTSPVK
jgi:hypothetical protein